MILILRNAGYEPNSSTYSWLKSDDANQESSRKTISEYRVDLKDNCNEKITKNTFTYIIKKPWAAGIM